jgi:transposase
LVSCDTAGWISAPVVERCSNAERSGAVRCVDLFHVIQLATDVLDEVRREVWREARWQGNIALAKDLKAGFSSKKPQITR